MENCTIVHTSTETYDISGEHRETNENPQEQLPIFLNVIPDMEDGGDGKKVTSTSGQMTFCNFNNICN